MEALFHRLNFTTKSEDNTIIRALDADSKKRVDLTIPFYGGSTHKLALDISITDTSSPSLETLKSPTLRRENEKNTKYGQLNDLPGVRFEPFVLTQGGRFGPSTKDLFNEVTAMSQLTGKGLANFRHFWRSRIVLAFHSSAAAGIRDKIEKIFQYNCGIRGCKQERHYNPDAFAHADACRFM